jgi:hypothetical protein
MVRAGLETLGVCLEARPEPDLAELAASRVRAALGLVRGWQPSTVARQLGVDYEERDLFADTDGEDAHLCVVGPAGFVIVVDPRVARREEWMDHPALGKKHPSDLSSATKAFRFAHELGHALCFDYRTGSRRWRWSVEEEGFCDRFARHLIVPPRSIRWRPNSTDSLAALMSRPLVSAEVALHQYVERFGGSVAAGVLESKEWMRLHLSLGSNLGPVGSRVRLAGAQKRFLFGHQSAIGQPVVIA